MTLIINNADVAKLLTIEETMDALERSYRNLAIGEAICRPRIDIRIPTSDPTKNYQFGSMEGGSTEGYFAVRMKSDVIYETMYNGAITREKYCMRPGLFCGLIFLTSIETGEPLAFINDGLLQHMRVAADGGIGGQISGEKGRRGGRHVGFGRDGQVSYAGLHGSATHQEAASLQPDERKPRGFRARDGGHV